MVWVGRDPEVHLCPAPLPWTGVSLDKSDCSSRPSLLLSVIPLVGWPGPLHTCSMPAVPWGSFWGPFFLGGAVRLAAEAACYHRGSWVPFRASRQAAMPLSTPKGCLSVCCCSPIGSWQRMWGSRAQGHDLCLPLPPHWMRLWDEASLNLAIRLWAGLGRF